MPRATKKRAFFSLYCTELQQETGKKVGNYTVLLNTQNIDVKSFEQKKYCPALRKHTIHKAQRISRTQNK
ncbi:50S ribosomal protein L33 [Candidatus Peribacteria bacterium]|nr:50S ribosomal protein L33 [Candidatus Peribacteria bacterium]